MKRQTKMRAILFGILTEVLCSAFLGLAFITSGGWGPCGPSNGIAYFFAIVGFLLNLPSMLFAFVIDAGVMEGNIFFMLAFTFHSALWAVIWWKGYFKFRQIAAEINSKLY